MIEIPALIVHSILASMLGYGVIRLASFLFTTKENPLDSRLISSELFGYFFVAGAVAVIATKGKTTYGLAFLMLLIYWAKNALKFKIPEIRISYTEFIILILNVLVHWLVFFDWKNHCFFSEWTDSYLYASNITSIMAIQKECVMHECGNALLGFDSEIGIYHYSEYYITILLKWIFGKSSYFNLFFVTIPVIMTIAQVQAIQFLERFSKIRGLNSIAFVLGITTCIRFFNAGILFFNEFQSLVHFPLFQISDYYNVYFYSYSGKIALFLMLFFSLYALWKENQMTRFSLALVIAGMLNLVFLPFFYLFFLLLALTEKKPIRQLFLPAILPIISLFPMIYLNIGKDLHIFNIKPEINFVLVASLKSTMSQFRNAMLFIMGNFYPHLIFVLLSFSALRKTAGYKLFFILVFLFPILLNIPFASGILLLGFVLLSIFFYLKAPASSMPVFACLLTLVILQAIFGIFHSLEYRDFFQFREFPLNAMACALPFLLLIEWEIPLSKYFWIAGFLLVIHNVSEMYFINNRTYFREESPLSFFNDFQKKTGGKHILAGYVSGELGNPVYIGLDNVCGYDLIHQSDSIDFFYLRHDAFSRIDSVRMARGLLAWKTLQRQPFIVFSKKHPEISNLDSMRIAFLKENKITAIFHKDEIPVEKIRYLQTYFLDSLYNKAEKYRVYFLDFQKGGKQQN